MKTAHRLTNVFWISISLLHFLFAGFLIYFVVDGTYKTGRAQIQSIRNIHLETNRQLLKNQVDQIVDAIVYEKELAHRNMRLEIKDRTYQAFHTARAIYQKFSGTLPDTEIISRILEALSSASWRGGEGYYFIQDLSGNPVLNRNAKQLGIQNLNSFQDPSGKKVNMEFVQIAQSPKGEGFISYQFKKPGKSTAEPENKISFIKKFEPYNWVMGAGFYTSDDEIRIKNETIRHIESFGGEDGAYLFAGDFEGNSFAGPFKGENLIGLTDSNGVNVTRELIQTAKNGGGFVQYIGPAYRGQPARPKISYCRSVPGWEWFIGTGKNIDMIETELLEKENILKQSIRFSIFKYIALTIFFWILGFSLIAVFTGKIRQNILLFTHFFEQSTRTAQAIDPENVVFREFKELAHHANKMAEQRTEAENRLKNSEHQFRHLFENTPAGVYEIDFSTNRFVAVNNYLCDYLGYTKEEILNMNPLDLLTPESRERFKGKYRKILHQEEMTDHNEFEVYKKDRSVFSAIFNSEFVYKNNRVTGARVVVTDISQRKRLEEIIRQSEKMVSLSGLAAGMAHEINNPLAGIMQNAQVMRNRLISDMPANAKAAEKAGIRMEQIRAYLRDRNVLKQLDHITVAGSRAAKIIESILDFSKRSAFGKTSVDILALMDKTLTLVIKERQAKKELDPGNIRVFKDYSTDLPRIYCNQSNLQQVFFHLIRNALESMDEKQATDHSPELRLKIVRDGKHVLIEIQDNGIGMDSEIKRRLFEPFFTTKAVDKGTGLGLSLSYYVIVDEHSGSIQVESVKGEGACFSIRLPV